MVDLEQKYGNSFYWGHLFQNITYWERPTYLSTDDWDHFFNISRYDVIGAGTHVRMAGYLSPKMLAMGRWYRSKDKLSGNHPYAGYLKKWHLNEVMSKKYKSMH